MTSTKYSKHLLVSYYHNKMMSYNSMRQALTRRWWLLRTTQKKHGIEGKANGTGKVTV